MAGWQYSPRHVVAVFCDSRKVASSVSSSFAAEGPQDLRNAHRRHCSRTIAYGGASEWVVNFILHLCLKNLTLNTSVVKREKCSIIAKSLRIKD